MAIRNIYYPANMLFCRVSKIGNLYSCLIGRSSINEVKETITLWQFESHSYGSHGQLVVEDNGQLGPDMCWLMLMILRGLADLMSKIQ